MTTTQPCSFFTCTVVVCNPHTTKVMTRNKLRPLGYFEGAVNAIYYVLWPQKTGYSDSVTKKFCNRPEYVVFSDRRRVLEIGATYSTFTFTKF